MRGNVRTNNCGLHTLSQTQVVIVLPSNFWANSSSRPSVQGPPYSFSPRSGEILLSLDGVSWPVEDNPAALPIPCALIESTIAEAASSAATLLYKMSHAPFLCWPAGHIMHTAHARARIHDRRRRPFSSQKHISCTVVSFISFPQQCPGLAHRGIANDRSYVGTA